MSQPFAFSDFSLPQPILSALTDLGYETPTPVQQQSIPIMLSGSDLLAQAQTGTGKTAAFALPLLAKIDLSVKKTQALVIAPTRELAIQVAEAFQAYAKSLKGFQVVSIYGGQDYKVQLRALKRGPQVIVGTPGRLMDHMRRKSLTVDFVKTVVLDEADEMLKMGFVEDIEWVMDQIKQDHQTGLFSATMPKSIQNIAAKYLNNPEKIQIKAKTNSVETIEQCYTVVAKNQKLALLTRFLETESVDAAIIFARTKNESSELAEKLQARGYAAAALNGDMNQALRKKTIERLKSKELDILVATDVAARGIDIEHVSHVFNYDVPFDTDTYIHRIGRTGRAGREGKSWLFVTPRERSLLKEIESAVKKPIQEIAPPSLKSLRERRHEKRVATVASIIQDEKNQLHRYEELLEVILQNTDVDLKKVACALLHALQQSDVSAADDLKIDKVSFSNFGGRNDRGRRNRSGGGRRFEGGGRRREGGERSGNKPPRFVERRQKKRNAKGKSD